MSWDSGPSWTEELHGWCEDVRAVIARTEREWR